FAIPSRKQVFGEEEEAPPTPPRPMQVGAPRPAPLVPEPEPERPRPVAEEKGFLRGSVEAVRRGVDEMRAAKRLGRAVAGIDPDTPGFVEEIPSGLKNLADATGRLSGGPEAVRRRLSPDQQAVLDREAAAYADLKRRNEENPLVDPESGFFKRGWFSGLNSVAGWIANMAAGADEAAAGAATGAGLALLAGQAGPQAALPEEIATVPGAAMAGAVRGLTAGSAKEWYFQGLGDSYADMVRNGIAPEAARDVASVMAVPYAAIEFLSGYLPGIRGMVRVGEGALRRVAAPQTAKAVLKSAFLRTLFNAPVEMGEEAGQSAVNDLAYNLAAKISNAENGTAVERRS
ncbi:MAG TPA: hypothetical protein P5204_13685, partial [Kiritimatiellia bacterium]|nr:hypothetical protein [Kiritimatiellia bacterium]